MEQKANARVLIRGKVQGVFFRVETKKAADRLGVTGWVRNRNDGSVEAVFEGEKKSVDEAVKWCWRGSPFSMVEDVKVEWGDYGGDFKAFDIKH